jgi:hypothetical protein
MQHVESMQNKMIYPKIMKNPNVNLASLMILFASNIILLSAGEISLVRTFETWNGGIIKSTDPSGITYHPHVGHLFISDSEINEITAIWNCENIFEINLTGDQVFNTFDSFNPGGQPCPPITNNRNREPTGITFNEFDGYFYISDDGEHAIIRYDNEFGEPLTSVKVDSADFEGITSDPSTGNLYVVSGEGQDEVNVFSSELEFMYRFSVADFIVDPEGIAYNSELNHLFLLSDQNKLKIIEVTLDGNFVADYNINNFIPTPSDPQGITFAPSSDPNDDLNDFNIYIVDGQIDNAPNPDNDRDGLIYEATIKPTIVTIESLSIPTEYSLDQNHPNPFNPETEIRFQLPEFTHVVLGIYNIHGQEIRGLLDKSITIGTYKVRWDGKDNYGKSAPSGVYFYKLQTSNYFLVKKMTLIK